MEEDQEVLEMVIHAIEQEPLQEDYRAVKLVTNVGDIDYRYYPAAGAKRGAIFVCGAGGGWDTPVKGVLYPQLCQELRGEAIACLRIRYRYPNRLEESVLDVLAGITFLESEGIEAIALLGHSFGGAVVICAAAISQSVRTVVALSSQTYGVKPASQLAPRCSLLLIHGTSDRVLPASCSQYIYSIAGEPKHLTLYNGADHYLDEVASEVILEVRQWIVDKLNAIAL